MRFTVLLIRAGASFILIGFLLTGYGILSPEDVGELRWQGALVTVGGAALVGLGVREHRRRKAKD